MKINRETMEIAVAVLNAIRISCGVSDCADPETDEVNYDNEQLLISASGFRGHTVQKSVQRIIREDGKETVENTTAPGYNWLPARNVSLRLNQLTPEEKETVLNFMNLLHHKFVEVNGLVVANI